MTEAKFEHDFCMKLVRKGCYVIKNNAGAGVPKGTPDRTVLMPGGGWAMLEFKKSADAPYKVLQKPQLARLKKMWYSASVYPENAAQIMKELEAMM